MDKGPVLQIVDHKFARFFRSHDCKKGMVKFSQSRSHLNFGLSVVRGIIPQISLIVSIDELALYIGTLAFFDI